MLRDILKNHGEHSMQGVMQTLYMKKTAHETWNFIDDVNG